MRRRSELLRMAATGSLALLVMAVPSRGVATETEAPPASGSVVRAEPTTQSSTVVLYYFHGTRRCTTCRTIESYAREAVESRFEAALRTGTLRWKVLDTDKPENSHFVEDFDLVSSSLVLVQLDRGKIARHEILQDVWTLVRDKPRFITYVQNAVAESLE